MRNKDTDFSLLKFVTVPAYNAIQGECGSPVRVEDVNRNGIVDHEDRFSPQTDQHGSLKDTSFLLHEMCMERRPGTGFHITEGAKELIMRFHGSYLAVEDPKTGEIHSRPTGSYDEVEGAGLGKLILLGAVSLSGLLHEGAELILGPRGALSVHGTYDPDFKACHYNRTVEVREGWGIHRDSLRVNYENATGRHVEFWDLKERTIK